MTEPSLQVRVERVEGEGPRVLAPSVGVWKDPPRPGTVVGPGSAVGRLFCLNRRYVLVMPEGCAGTVERGASAGAKGVAFGETLFTLRPLSRDKAPSGQGGEGDLESEGGRGAGGGHAVCAPTDGVFYRRPSPEAPPFVEVGCRVRAGQPVGLVEVMKTFNQIVYGGPGLPEEGEVLEIRCDDGTEVSAGQTLLVVR